MSGPSIGYWEFFAEECRRAGAPLYVCFSEGVAGDETLRALAARVRDGQPMANILFGAVHFLLLRGADHPLRRHYRNLNGGALLEGEDPFPLFADFCASHRDRLLPLITTRVTNTNEVGRSGALNAGFRALALEAGEPLHLIEIGPSAGLNLIWDRYRIRYTRGSEIFQTDVPNARLTLDLALRGDGTPPVDLRRALPAASGLERNPVDLANDDDRDWLRALVWPDQIERFARLDAALDVYQGAKPEIRVGDALELLPEVLAQIPKGETLCVYHTLVTYQFSPPMRRALDDLLTAAGLRRAVWRLSLEGTANNECPLRLRRYHDGTKEERVLAQAHPHGLWLEWLV